jgi:hypothetical protein
VRNDSLVVVLCSCEAWSISLRRIFGRKKEEVTRDGEKLHDKEFHTLL